jgi:cytochrome c peroxidase
VAGRYGNRKPPTVSYAAFIPSGPPTLNSTVGAYVGGLFFDGRATDLTAQAAFPLQNPNEMDDLVHNVGSPALVVQKVLNGPSAHLFVQAYGAAAVNGPVSQVFEQICSAIAAFEETSIVSPFNSQYDAFASGHGTLSPSELNGLRLVTGSVTGRPGGQAFTKNAQCVLCHAIPAVHTANSDLWTGNFYLNTGVPKNPNNPFYTETNATSNPVGYNPEGAAYIDYGLGDFLYPQMNLPSGNVGSGQGDFLGVNGTFKTPTLRNVDKRPSPDFVKAYGHNGFFKSLAQIVHFYNVRNLTTVPGEVIDFTKANPYANLKGKPLFPTPEYPSPKTLINPQGLPGQIGNLGLSPQDEADIVNFLTTLSDQ